MLVLISLAATNVADATSHREAPGTAEDPTADITDFYAFVSPEDPTKVVFLLNIQPLANPGGGPNFHGFGNDVIYQIHIDNEGDGLEDVTLGFRPSVTYQYPGEFLYNLGDITVPANLNHQQVVDVARWDDGVITNVIVRNTPVAPANVGVASDPTGGYDPTSVTADAITAWHTYDDGTYRVYAGPRQESFFLDLERTFDLLNLGGGGNVNTLLGYNVHTLAIEVPINSLTKDGAAPSAGAQNEVIAAWATTSRKRTRTYNADGTITGSGPLQQLARLGNPLVNELVIGVGDKNLFNFSHPSGDGQFLDYVINPTLPIYMEAILGVPNPGSHDEGLGVGGREDLFLAFLTGHPAVGNQPGGFALGGAIPGEPGKVFGAFEALRLNLTTPMGWPNGRLVGDDVADTALSAMGGLLIDGTTVPDGVDATGLTVMTEFPFLGSPWAGDAHPQNFHL